MVLNIPLGIGEVLRQAIGKTINWVLKDDIQEAAASLQTATGLKVGSEAAIHSKRAISKDPSTEDVILVDATNNFNSLNRKVALHNTQTTCPSFRHILINYYRTFSGMIIIGCAEIPSTEGTTQGDNLPMSFYAIVTVKIQQIPRISVLDA